MQNGTFVSLIPHALNPGGHDIIYHSCLEKISMELGLGHRALVAVSTSAEFPRRWERFFRHQKWRFLDFSRLFFHNQKRSIFFLETFNTRDFCALTIAAFFFLKKTDILWI